MKIIELKNAFYRYVMLVTADGKLRHGMFVPASEKTAELPVTEDEAFPYEAFVNLNYEPLTALHGNRYIYPSATERAVYVGMQELPIEGGTDYVLTLRDFSTGADIHLHYEVYRESPALRRYTVIENRGESALTVNHVSSAVLSNFPYGEENEGSLFLHRFASGWSYEGEHQCDSFGQLRIYRGGLTGFCTSTTAGWVCQDYIPCFVVEERNGNRFTAVQIEHSSAWRFELGNETHYDYRKFYLQCGIGNDWSAGWNMELAPGASFRTPSASLTVSGGKLDDVLNLLHIHQEKVLIHRQEQDRSMPVIFNDWLCLRGQVSEEAILSQIETLASLGIEYYVTDAGWFTKMSGENSDWNAMVGCWDYDTERFPNGMKHLTDEIKRRGMKAGIWCEIEAVGRNAAIYEDPNFVLRRGDTFVTGGYGRHFLNFTSKDARDYATAVIDQFASWGFEYLKIDYNADPAPSVTNAGSQNGGHGLHENRRAYDEWLDAMRQRHPQILLESCSSGGMRLEYNSLSRAELASVTDQENYLLISRIAYNITRTVHPSQCGIWTPASFLGNDTDNFVFALASSMMGRMHLSGDLCHVDGEKNRLIRDAVAFYKRYRDILPGCRVYHHSGDVFYYEEEKPYALELRAAENNRSVVMLKNYHLPDADCKAVVLCGLEDGSYEISSFPHMSDIPDVTVKGGVLPLHRVLPSGKRAQVLYIKRKEGKDEI